MTGRDERIPEPERRPPRSFLAKAVWVLAGFSLLLTVADILWARLYVPAFVVGAAALVVSVVVSRRGRSRPFSWSARTLVSAIAAVLPVLIVGTMFAAIGVRQATLPQPETLDVDLRVVADGDFTLTYTGDVDTVDAEASDDFETSFTTRYNSMQLFIVLAPENLGPNTIRCEISINGTLVVERSTEDRHLDCTSDLQDLHHDSLEEG
jgi:hypothetical protein